MTGPANDDPGAAKVTISYIGHNTLLLSVDGVRLLTDPMLHMRFPLLRRHATPPDLRVLADLDAILISHLHLDHANPRSLRLLPRDIPLVVPTGAGRILRRYHFQRLTELAPGESLRVGEVTVTATPARHDGRRYPWGHKAGAVGYMIEGSKKLYFAGDTGLFDGLADLGGDLDVALLPIWGWGLRLPDDHLSPLTAAQALRLLRPRMVIPIHWGTFLPLGAAWWYGRYLIDPPQAFLRHVGEYAPEVRAVLLQPGESITLQAGALGGVDGSGQEDGGTVTRR
jgi:L-ascorbate metabolism protein UlaG (beta-lactamase superfamily)